MTGVQVPSIGSRRVPGAEPGTRALGDRITPATMIIALAALGLALRLYCVLRPGFLLGIAEYDDGSYFGSSVRLMDGVLPYRDFVFVQPPGITILMVPAALAAKLVGATWGLALGRIVTALAGTASIVLAGLLVRHRGRLAVLLTCGICAIHPDAVLAARTVLVEPWLVLMCLIGALAVFDGGRLATGRRVIWGGVAFGFAGVIEAWAIVPVLVLIAASALRPRRAAGFAAGVAAGFLIPTLPFFALAPASFYRSVIIAQIAPRPGTVSVYGLYRIRLMAGLSDILHTPAVLVITVTLLTVGFVLAGTITAWWLLRQPPPALDWFTGCTGGLMALIFLWPPQFHYHFVGFLVPFLAMTVGLTAGRLAFAVRPRLAARRPAAVPASRWAPALLALAGILAGGAFQARAETRLQPSLTAAQLATVRRVIPPGACVLADQVSYLVAVDRFTSDVPGCPVIDDGTGVNYALSHGLNTGTGAGQVPSVAALWRSAFAHSQYVWLSYHAHKRIPWIPSIVRYFHAHFHRVRAAGPHIRIYQRRS